MAKDTPAAEAEPAKSKSEKQAKSSKQAKGLGGAGLKSKKEKVRIIKLEDGTEVVCAISRGPAVLPLTATKLFHFNFALQ